MNKTATHVLSTGPTIHQQLKGMSQEELIEEVITLQTVLAILMANVPINVPFIATAYPDIWKDLADILNKFDAAGAADLDSLKRRN